jgi:hypothetical protein
MLATQPEPVEADAVRRRYASALGWGAFGATLLMALILGVREDLTEAATLPMFWLKLGYPVVIAAGALCAAARLGRPGVAVGGAAWAIVAPVVFIWAAAAVALALSQPGERLDLVMGETALACPLYISLLSTPVFVAAFWAMTGLAPTRLALAGAAAGLLAGAVATAVYALHCPEMAAPFLATWYLIGMLAPAAAGALLGPMLLRW